MQDLFSFFNKKTALVNLLVGRKMTLSLNRAQTLFNHADKVVMSDVSHGTDDHIFSGIIALQIGLEFFLVKRTDFLRRSQNCPPQSLIRKSLLLQIVKDNIVRHVDCLFNFLNHNLTFFQQFAFGKSRVFYQVGQNVNCQFGVAFQHLGIERGKFPCRIGIRLSAHIFKLFRNFKGVAGFGSFKDHVFQKMGNTVHFLSFKSRTGLYPNAERDCFNLRTG